MIQIFTDGAAQGNPGPGGYGTILRYGKYEKELSEGFRLTTNNRMELMAVIAGLEAITKKGIPVTIISDSKYVVEAIEKGWLWTWEKNDFKKKANPDLWRRYIPLHHKFKPNFKWIKGHAGHQENERCDQLAVEAAQSAYLLVDQEYENNN
ncbi:MAG TPA: ribonuclease HI [Cyclobacteriaceae bacterium]